MGLNGTFSLVDFNDPMKATKPKAVRLDKSKFLQPLNANSSVKVKDDVARIFQASLSVGTGAELRASVERALNEVSVAREAASGIGKIWIEG
ncbi:hypothetical protein SB783_39560 [Paraburkholderia sp. SIMBA_009]